jgi:hypothetical protein
MKLRVLLLLTTLAVASLLLTAEWQPPFFMLFGPVS